MLQSATIELAKRTFNFLLDLLYPPCCGGCGRVADGWWCSDCDAHAPWLKDEEGMTTQPVEGYPDLEVISIARFEAPLREAIHCFKYDGQPQLAAVFGKRMGARWARCAQRVDAIVPVPLHASRLRERGFNQSELLAREISIVTGIPVQARALRRVRATRQQARLDDAQARRANMRGAFAATQTLVDSRALLLVDDVLTTGATLTTCAAALYQAGAGKVIALTLARA